MSVATVPTYQRPTRTEQEGIYWHLTTGQTDTKRPAKTLRAKFIYRGCSYTSCMGLIEVISWRTKEESCLCWARGMLSSWIARPLWPSAVVKTHSDEDNAEHFLKDSCLSCLLQLGSHPGSVSASITGWGWAWLSTVLCDIRSRAWCLEGIMITINTR